MTPPETISPDEWKEWRTNHVTKAVVNELTIEYAFIAGALGRGEILNLENPTVTHGNAARAWGQLESLKALIEYISDEAEDYK